MPDNTNAACQLFNWCKTELARKHRDVVVGDLVTAKPSRFCGINFGSPKQQFDVYVASLPEGGLGAEFVIKEKPGSPKIDVTTTIDIGGAIRRKTEVWEPERMKEFLGRVTNHLKR